MASENLPQLWAPREHAMVKTDLYPQKLAASETLDEELVGDENIEESDLIVPTLMLLQGQSQAVLEGVPGAQPGKFMLSTTQEVFEAPLRVLIVHHAKSRALFPKEQHPGLEQCFSRDMVEGTRYGSCEQCPHKEWREGPDGNKNLRPPCSTSHNFGIILKEGPAILRLAGKSYKNGKKFVSAKLLAKQNWWKYPTVVRVHQKTREVAGASQIYFICEIIWDIPDPLALPQRQAARKVYDLLNEAYEEGRLTQHGADADDKTNDGSDVPY